MWMNAGLKGRDRSVSTRRTVNWFLGGGVDAMANANVNPVLMKAMKGVSEMRKMDSELRKVAKKYDYELVTYCVSRHGVCMEVG